ncbi:MAG: hypothetical protein RIF33_24580 [Cyclobacteriaceae bacterium]
MSVLSFSRNWYSLLRKSFLFALVLAIISCSDDSNEGPSGVSISNEAATQFSNITNVAAEAQRLWPTYDYLSTFPILLLLDDPDISTTQGYILNAPDPIPQGSELVSESQTAGYDAYRNSDMAQLAIQELGEFGRFLFEFPYEGTVYFVVYDKPLKGYFYDDYKNLTGGWVSMILAHELFHKFQLKQWQISQEWIQNTQDYPFETELLAWHLYYYDLMADAHLASNATEAESYARRYVAAMTKMHSLDPSEEQLVTAMGTYQELFEGSARYIETYSVLPEVFPGVHQDPTHGWRDILYNATEEGTVRTAIAFRLWYHSGAAATHLLQLMEVDVQSQYVNFVTPFELASQRLNLNDATLSEIQAQITNDASWSSYEARAAELMLIMEN